MPIQDAYCPAQRITTGPYRHFFGYYDKSPWDAMEKTMLALRVSFMDRPPTPEDVAHIGRVHLEDGCRWQPLAETAAWNWQQGTMLQWLPPTYDREAVFNSRTDVGFDSTVLDVEAMTSRHLSRPIYALAPNGRYAVTLSFARVHRTRPGYGYSGVPDAWVDDPSPARDGIYSLDLRTGESRLIISLAEIAGLEHVDEMDGAVHWFNHLQFNPSGTRFIFLHRYRSTGAQRWVTRLFTADADGSNIAYLAREGVVSHFDWQDDDQVLAWSRYRGAAHYHLYRDRSDHVQVIGADVLDCDGHCSYSPDRNWILTDTYPDRKRWERTLILYHPGTNTRFNIGRFYSSPQIGGEIRCDLHPRWSRDGRQVCIDSIHERERQMYVVDVSEIVGSDLATGASSSDRK